MISTAKRDVIYLYVWSGDASHARDLLSSRYPGSEIREFPHRRLRESAFFERICLLREFRGQAVVFYLESLDEFRYRQMIECSHFLHRCRETVLCDAGGRWEPMRTYQILRSAPRVLWSILLDLKTLIFWWCYLRIRLLRAAPVVAHPNNGDLEIGYLIPSLASMGSSGGAISHIRGFLYGLKGMGRTCRVFSGTPLAQDAFDNEIVDPAGRPYFFWEAAMLSYNFCFARGVQRARLHSARAAVLPGGRGDVGSSSHQRRSARRGG